jgi:hypothetical protein
MVAYSSVNRRGEPQATLIKPIGFHTGRNGLGAVFGPLFMLVAFSHVQIQCSLRCLSLQALRPSAGSGPPRITDDGGGVEMIREPSNSGSRRRGRNQGVQGALADRNHDEYVSCSVPVADGKT